MPETAEESGFFDPRLLDLEYFKRQRFAYERYFEEGLISKYRCYPIILSALQKVHDYRPEHAKSFAKRLRTSNLDLRNSDAIVCEAIVYAHYVPLVREGRIQGIDLCKDDFDLKITRLNQTSAYLEVFCVTPDFQKNERGVIDVRTHTQEAFASVRQKLLRKAKKQQQFQKCRENWAVIELNEVTIAGSFTVAASLSDGYKVVLDRASMKVIDSGFDWSKSVFDLPETCQLHGVINFDLGFYEGRRYILNSRVSGQHEVPPNFVP